MVPIKSGAGRRCFATAVIVHHVPIERTSPAGATASESQPVKDALTERFQGLYVQRWVVRQVSAFGLHLHDDAQLEQERLEQASA